MSCLKLIKLQQNMCREKLNFPWPKYDLGKELQLKYLGTAMDLLSRVYISDVHSDLFLISLKCSDFVLYRDCQEKSVLDN